MSDDKIITDPAAYDARRTAATRTINRRQGTGKPGDNWRHTEPIGGSDGRPFYEGAHGRARLYVTGDGREYDVRVYGHNGSQRAARTFRGLDAALRFGQRIADQAHAGTRAVARPGTDPRIAAIVATLTPPMLDGLTSVAHVHSGAGTPATHAALVDRGLIVSVDAFPYAAATLDGRRVLFAVQAPGHADPDTDPATAYQPGARVLLASNPKLSGAVSTVPAMYAGRVRVQWDDGHTIELHPDHIGPVPAVLPPSGCPGVHEYTVRRVNDAGEPAYRGRDRDTALAALRAALADYSDTRGAWASVEHPGGSWCCTEASDVEESAWVDHGDGVRVHTFDTTSAAYDATQGWASIRDGDVVVIPAMRVVGFLLKAWPVAVTVEHGELHEPAPGAAWNADAARYAASIARASAIADGQGWPLNPDARPATADPWADLETVTSAAVDAATRWRSIPADEAFTCTACGRGTVYGGGTQTLDGAQRLCTVCDTARIDAHWCDRPAGASEVRVTGADGTSTSGGVFTHQPYPYPTDVSPSVQWGLIVSAAADWSNSPVSTRRRIGGRVAAALRAVYDIPGADDAGLTTAREADPRNADDRARVYLAAYATTLTGATQVEPVERRALAFATTS